MRGDPYKVNTVCWSHVPGRSGAVNEWRCTSPSYRFATLTGIARARRFYPRDPLHYNCRLSVDWPVRELVPAPVPVPTTFGTDARLFFFKLLTHVEVPQVVPWRCGSRCFRLWPALMKLPLNVQHRRPIFYTFRPVGWVAKVFRSVVLRNKRKAR